MNDERRFTRRDALKAGAALAGAGALEAANLAAFAQAWAQASPLEARKGRQAAAAALEALRAVARKTASWRWSPPSPRRPGSR